MVRLMVLDVDNAAVEGVPNNKARGEKTVMQSSVSSAQRKKLADISNFPDQAKVMNRGAKQQQQQNTVLSSNEYIERLQKENMTLMKVLTERNKIIELSGIELQKLRINLQKMQEQNLQLAQANNQMLAELNMDKDRLKVLHHELGCKNGLLKVKSMKFEKPQIPTTHHDPQDEVRANILDEPCESIQADDMDRKNTKRKRQSRIQPSGSSIIESVPINEKVVNKRRVSGRKNSANADVTYNPGCHEVTCQTEENANDTKLVLDEADPAQENVHNKRHRLRRQSTRFDCRDSEQSEDLHGTDDAKVMRENARPSSRRQSARLKSQAPESPENLQQMHELKETTKIKRASVRRQSMKIDFHEPEPNGTSNDPHDAQETTGDAGCSARRESDGSKSDVVEPTERLLEIHNTEEITGRQRSSSRERISTELEGIISKKAAEPSSDDSVKASGQGDEREGTRRVSVGRPSRHAAVKIQSYKEVSLKVKMRRSR